MDKKRKIEISGSLWLVVHDDGLIEVHDNPNFEALVDVTELPALIKALQDLQAEFDIEAPEGGG